MTSQSHSELKRWTVELKKLNEEAQDFYMNVARKVEDYEPDFYEQVKPFADKVKEYVEHWLPLAMDFVQTERPLYLHPSQISQTVDNFEVVAIKSFYKKTSLKLQMETFKAVTYVLDQVLVAIDS